MEMTDLYAVCMHGLSSTDLISTKALPRGDELLSRRVKMEALFEASLL